MEDSNNRGEVQANVTNQCSLRSGSSLKSMLSARSTPQHSRSNSSLTPRSESKGGAQCFGSNRLLLWLLLITLWAYLGFYVQSRLAHDDKEDKFSGFGSDRSIDTNSDFEQNQHHDLIVVNNSLSVNIETVENKMDVVLAKKEYGVLSHLKAISKKRIRQSMHTLRGKARGMRKRRQKVESSGVEEQEPEIPQRNATYRFLVGPFGSIEDRILQRSLEVRSESCNKKGNFANLVRSRRFVLIFHELSMTGAPLSMMELATELLNCGASVSAVVLSKKGGLMQELARRQIKVLGDKASLSFKTAMKAHLVIAGSAVCAAWIEQYIKHFPAGTSQIVWWIMENRREYFDRSKHVLHRVKILVFLSVSQSKQWQKWCDEESIKLRSQPALVPLSVNDELAFVAGISSTLNTSSFSADNMEERRKLLRDSVRKEMGLTDNDMLVISLSSINRGKGQLLLLESARSIVEYGPLQNNKKMQEPSDDGEYLSTLARRHHIRNLLKESSVALTNISSNFISSRRKEVLSHNNGTTGQSLKILIGSVGSKSNKVDYVKGLLSFLARHSNLSKSAVWTPATTHVASLYSAADIYVINSQGLGETFGRVTIEAMAFGLPVLGTHAGGTQEIVEHNVTGLLHPIGRPGNHVLTQNLRFLLENRLAREKMGIEGRKKVQRMYLKQHMYNKFVEVLVMCMRSK